MDRVRRRDTCQVPVWQALRLTQGFPNRYRRPTPASVEDWIAPDIDVECDDLSLC